jgi:ABC-type nitrate/sulfonate/bicarbonate transport system substrate-binding protein
VKNRFLVGVLVGAAVFALGPVSAVAQDKATLATATAPSFVPSRAAVDFGWFKAEGLDLDIKMVTGGNDAIQALAGGSVEFGESSHAQYLAAAARNLPIVAIGLHSYGFLGRMIAAPRHASLTSLADFKGKRIGVQAGTGVYTVFLMALEHNRLNAADYTITNIRVNDMPAAMQSDTFDAVMAWDPAALRIVQSGKGKEVISATKFEELAEITYPFMILTTEKMIRERPQTVQRYLNVFARAQRFMISDRKGAVAVYRKYLPSQVTSTVDDAELESQIYGASRFDRLVPNERDLSDLKRTADFMVRQKTLDKMPNFDSAMNLKFARATAARGN